MRTLLIVLVTAAITGTAVFFAPEFIPGLRAKPANGTNGKVGTGPDSSNRNEVTARGRLEPESHILGVSAPSGSRIFRVLVREDAHVRAGDKLALLDSHEEMKAAYEHAEATLKEARQRKRSEEHTSELQ